MRTNRWLVLLAAVLMVGDWLLAHYQDGFRQLPRERVSVQRVAPPTILLGTDPPAIQGVDVGGPAWLTFEAAPIRGSLRTTHAGVRPLPPDYIRPTEAEFDAWKAGLPASGELQTWLRARR